MNFKTYKNRKGAILITVILIIAVIVAAIKIIEYNRKKKLKEKLIKVASAYLTKNEGFEFYDEKMRITYISHPDSLTVIFSYNKLELTKYNSYLDARVYKINKNDFGLRELKIYRDPSPENVRANSSGSDTDDYYW